MSSSYISPVITASGTTFAQFRNSGFSGHLERLITANYAGASNPSAAATIATGTTVGGGLAAGTYYLKVTETNGIGETAASPESAQFTVSAQSAPTGTPTVVVSGSGGTLAVGVYFGKITYVDSNLNGSGVHGETTAGTEFTFTQTTAAEPTITFNDGGLPAWASGRNVYLTLAAGASGSEVLAFTGKTGTTFQITTAPATSTTAAPTLNTTSTNLPVVTFAALQTGNLARNTYLTPANGATGTEVLYARGTTAGTLTLAVIAPSDSSAVPPPSANMTAFTTREYEMLRSGKAGNFEDVYRRMAQHVSNFNTGAPMSSAEAVNILTRTHVVFALLAQICAEVGALIVANPGHIGAFVNSAGVASPMRTWP